MPAAILYVDGSSVRSKEQRLHSLGWSSVLLTNDCHHERSGSMQIPLVSPALGYHEHLAFVHGVVCAADAGVDFGQLTIYCDHQDFGYAQTHLHAENCRQSMADVVMARLDHALAQGGLEHARGLVLQVFASSRIVKLKGHSQCVYQERTDYLAKHAARNGLGEATEDLLDLHDWMCRGLRFFDHSQDPPQTAVWRAPFVEGCCG